MGMSTDQRLKLESGTPEEEDAVRGLIICEFHVAVWMCVYNGLVCCTVSLTSRDHNLPSPVCVLLSQPNELPEG